MVSVFPGPAPDGIKPPYLLAVDPLKTNLVERDRHLDLVTGVGDPTRRLPHRVPRVVIVAANVIVDGVDLNSERGAEQLVGSSLIVEGIEDNPHPVVVPSLVSIRIPSANLGRIGIVGPEPEIDMPLVIGNKADGLYRWGDVLARPYLIREFYPGGGFPGGFIESAIQGEGGACSRHLVNDRWVGKCQAGQGRGQEECNDRGQKMRGSHSPFFILYKYWMEPGRGIRSITGVFGEGVLSPDSLVSTFLG